MNTTKMVQIKDFDHHTGEPFASPTHGKTIREVGYCLRLLIPFGYGDAVWRLRVYGWITDDNQIDEQGWFATINSTRLGQGYETPQSAALAIRRAIGKLGRSLEQSLTTNDLVPPALTETT